MVGISMVVTYTTSSGGGLSLPWKKFGINDVDKIVKRAPAEAENHARVKRPLTWEIMRVMEESIGDWGIAWRIG